MFGITANIHKQSKTLIKALQKFSQSVIDFYSAVISNNKEITTLTPEFILNMQLFVGSAKLKKEDMEEED